MWRRGIPVVALTIALLPAQASAALCFSVGGFTTVVLTGFLAPEGFIAVVGEAVNTCRLPNGDASGQSAPFTGTAHGRADATAHFAISVGGTANCFPMSIEGTLTPPSYATGTGTVDNPSLGGFSPVNFAPANCPSFD